MASEDEREDIEFDDVPLHRKRPFGSGLTRKRIEFVPASTRDLTATEQAARREAGKSIGDMYLNMVLSKDAASSDRATLSGKEICEICRLPLTPNTSGNDKDRTESGVRLVSTPKHETSLAHQVCLDHSHPPSALDRSRMGFTYLQNYGWDADGRVGLGSDGQGIQYPIKVKPKDGNLGIGVVVPKDFVPKKSEKPKQLDAKKVRKMAQEDKKKTEKLQQQLFGKVDLEKYLGKD